MNGKRELSRSVNAIKRLAVLVAALLFMPSAQAQVYRSVDANGKTVFSDKPPPDSVRPAMPGNAGNAGKTPAGATSSTSESGKNVNCRIKSVSSVSVRSTKALANNASSRSVKNAASTPDAVTRHSQTLTVSCSTVLIRAVHEALLTTANVAVWCRRPGKRWRSIAGAESRACCLSTLLSLSDKRLYKVGFINS